ncbi:hypothetical protein [Streptomyces sp. NPDC050738]|uniref:hypothetical protein n=1 Tax=Streptomyces sp. NPDC050738 TaxID=3154744 RepID=UPI00341FA2DB
MDDSSFSLAWLAEWREQINEAVTALLTHFEDDYGYRPGANEVRAADEDDLRAALDFSREPLAFTDLAAFYSSVGEVSLPDIGNGYFIHSARQVLHQLAEEGPVFLPESDDPQGMVIASNGGGQLYAADWGGAIHRSRTASQESEFDRVADDLPAFLDLVRRAVLRFTRSGEPGLV